MVYAPWWQGPSEGGAGARLKTSGPHMVPLPKTRNLFADTFHQDFPDKISVVLTLNVSLMWKMNC